jgi:hypothetical protein
MHFRSILFQLCVMAEHGNHQSIEDDNHETSEILEVVRTSDLNTTQLLGLISVNGYTIHLPLEAFESCPARATSLSDPLHSCVIISRFPGPDFGPIRFRRSTNPSLNQKPSSYSPQSRRRDFSPPIEIAFQNINGHSQNCLSDCGPLRQRIPDS